MSAPKLKSLGQAVYGEPQACPKCGYSPLSMAFGTKVQGKIRIPYLDTKHAWCPECHTMHETEPPDNAA